MTTINTSDLTGSALDWAVDYANTGKPLAVRHSKAGDSWMFFHGAIPYEQGPAKFSTDPSQGHPIIEREGIATIPGIRGSEGDGWTAWKRHDEDAEFEGPTALIAAMRCFVASHLGETVDVPHELLP